MGRVGEVVPLRSTEDRRAQYVVRRAFVPGRLAVVASGPAAVVMALADDVLETDVAAIRRHLGERHAQASGVSACRAPYCDGAERWRPVALAVTIASSA